MTVPPLDRIADLVARRSSTLTALDLPVGDAVEVVRAIPVRLDAGLAIAGDGLRSVLDQAPRRRARRAGRRRAVVVLVAGALITAAAAWWWGRRAATTTESERRFDDESLARAADEGMAADPGPWRMSPGPEVTGGDGQPPTEREPAHLPIDEVVVRQSTVGIGIAPRQ